MSDPLRINVRTIGLVVFGLIIFFGTPACSSDPSNRGLGNNSSAPLSDPSGLPTVSLKIKLSPEAQKVSDLIDDKKMTAADELLTSYLKSHPDDAGLHVQFVRYVVAINSDSITDLNQYGEAARSAKIASELQPETKPYLVYLLLSDQYSKFYKKAAAGQGALTSSGYISYMTFSPSDLAIEVGPELAKQWSPKFDGLTLTFAKLGFPVSSMVSGQIAGDLASGKQGDEGFKKATQGFQLAIESGKVDMTGWDSAARSYVIHFDTECHNALAKKDADYMKLLAEIKRRQYSLAAFQNNGVLPPDLMPTPTPTPTPSPTPKPSIAPTVSNKVMPSNAKH